MECFRTTGSHEEGDWFKFLILDTLLKFIQGFDSYIKAEDADILVLTETKVSMTADKVTDYFNVHSRSMKNRPIFFQQCTPINTGRYLRQKAMVQPYWLIIFLMLIFFAAGTAVLCKHKPLNVKLDFPTHPDGDAAAKGRLVVLEYSTLWIVGTYVPNAGQNLKVTLYIYHTLP